MIIFGGRLIDHLLKQIDVLQEDNRALTEALVRVEGKPLVFRKSTEPAKDSEGWFDKRMIDADTK